MFTITFHINHLSHKVNVNIRQLNQNLTILYEIKSHAVTEGRNYNMTNGGCIRKKN